VHQYVQDNDELMPCGRQTLPATSPPKFSGTGWGGLVYPYVGSGQMYTCPDDPAGITTYPGIADVPISYAINTNLCGSNNQVSAYVKNLIAAFNDPTRTILFSEVETTGTGWSTDVSAPNETNSLALSPSGNGDWLSNDGPGNACASCDLANGGIHYVTGWMSGRGNGTTAYQSWQAAGTQVGPQTGVHLSGANFAFMDGHVKWLLGSAVSAGFPAVNSTDAQTSNGSSKAAGTLATVAPFEATYSPT